MQKTEDQKHMQLALEQAKLAADSGEVPIGAVITTEDNQIFTSYNMVETNQDACSHAEINVIKLASLKLKRWRLEDCTIYITLEPCPMCMGAIRLSRIKRVVIGALDSRMGSVSNFKNITESKEFGTAPEIVTGIMEDECKTLLKEFFKKIRGG